MVVFIGNASIKVGIDEKQGGAICHLSRGDNAPNVINTWDTGRLLQQSYYGNPDGSKWNGKDWVWNPVQGGSWDNKTSKMVSLQRLSDTEVVVKTQPRNWAGCQLCDDVLMITHITVMGNDRINVKCSMEYSGMIPHAKRRQEIPACFLNANFSHLVYRDKKTKEIKQVIPDAPGGKNTYRDAFPKWVGFVDPRTNDGVFILSKDATLVTAYRVDIPGNPPESNCSYVAPLMECALKGPCRVTYEFNVKLKKLDSQDEDD
jgi:hypothetical protein